MTRTAAGAPNLNSGGYGFGLGISQSCEFDQIVAHSGGLPGYGSMMRWLPSYGVGVIAFGNVTYTGWGGVVTQAFDLMAKTGGLQPRVPQPSPTLVASRDAVSRLIMNWDDKQADDMAAMNLFLDSSKDRRQKQVADLRAKVGTCAAPTTFDSVENWLRGPVDHEVRTRRPERVDHAGADDAAEGAVPGREAGGTAAGAGNLQVEARL